MALAAHPRVGHVRRHATRLGDVGIRETAALSVAVGLAFIVGRDGSPVWQLVRLVTLAAVTAVAHRAIRRWDGARRGAVAFGLGTVALAVGVAIALPFLSKNGLTAMAVAGVATTAGGLVLTSAGAASLVRSTSRWWRLFTAPGLLLATVVMLYTLGQAVAFTNVPRTAVGSTTPADVGLTHRDASFASSDGVMLSGWYVPSTTGAAVVLLHGAGSTRSNVLDHAVVLARHGYGALLFDARGHGRSDGRAMDAGWWGDEDIAGAVSFLELQPDVDPSRIAAVGMWMGGEQAIGAAGSDERIAAVVAEGAEQRVAADTRWQSEEMGVRGWLQEQIDRLEFALADLLTSAAPPMPLRAAVAAMAPRPALLITAGDVPEEATKGRFIQAGAPETVDLWTVPGAGHTDGVGTAPADWERRVVGFLDTALGRATAGR